MGKAWQNPGVFLRRRREEEEKTPSFFPVIFVGVCLRILFISDLSEKIFRSLFTYFILFYF